MFTSWKITGFIKNCSCRVFFFFLSLSLQIVEDIMSRAATEKVAVSFDCEGINLGVKGQLTLFQLGTESGLAYIFDLITCPTLVSAGGLQHLLESENVTKVSNYSKVSTVLCYRPCDKMLYRTLLK
jgi:exonuclease 3'-5' domain-containing protein 1